jgi:hypothetical protein
MSDLKSENVSSSINAGFYTHTHTHTFSCCDVMRKTFSVVDRKLNVFNYGKLFFLFEYNVCVRNLTKW